MRTIDFQETPLIGRGNVYKSEKFGFLCIFFSASVCVHQRLIFKSG